MSEPGAFDHLVGRIAGAIYGDISSRFPQPPLVLVPALTFKVRRVLEQMTSLQLLSTAQKGELAKEIELAIVPMLFSYEIESDVIKKVAPIISNAAFKALTEEH